MKYFKKKTNEFLFIEPKDRTGIIEIDDSEFERILAELETGDYELKIDNSGTPYTEINIEFQKQNIRNRREIECFPFINRGELWYLTLTQSQKNELTVWYQNWLDATETKAIPPKPTWL